MIFCQFSLLLLYVRQTYTGFLFSVSYIFLYFGYKNSYNLKPFLYFGDREAVDALNNQTWFKQDTIGLRKKV